MTNDELRKLLDDESHVITMEERNVLVILLNTNELYRVQFAEMRKEVESLRDEAAQKRRATIAAFKAMVNAALDRLATS
jgi:hypothetical protein